MLKRLFILLLFTATLLNATTPTESNVARLYVATLDRAPDADGLTYWVESSGLNLEQIALSFFDQPELDAKYPKGTTYREFIQSIYTNLFKRTPDDTGWDYWEEELESGSVARSLFILAIINGALEDDAKILANRATVGLSYAKSGKNDVPQAINILKGITANTDSISTALCLYKIVECVDEKPVVAMGVVEEEEVKEETTINDGGSTSSGGSTLGGGSTSSGTSNTTCNITDIYPEFFIAKDNKLDDIIKEFNGIIIKVMSNSKIENVSMGTNAIYGLVDGHVTNALLKINTNYIDDTTFVIKIYRDDKLVALSDELIFNDANPINFGKLNSSKCEEK